MLLILSIDFLCLILSDSLDGSIVLVLSTEIESLLYNTDLYLTYVPYSFGPQIWQRIVSIPNNFMRKIINSVTGKNSLCGQWAAANCNVPPSVIVSQYATLNCKLLLVRVSL